MRPIHATLAVALTSALMVPVELPLLRRLVPIDTPSHRSSHSSPTLRGGGIGVIIAAVLGFALLPSTGTLASALLLAAVGMGAIGLADDMFGVPAAARLLLQLTVGWLIVIQFEQSGAWMIVGQVIAISVCVNAFNFMDGVDGVASVCAVVAGGYFAALGGIADLPLLNGCGLVVAAAALGFLPYNAVRARLFLGDVGSYALGGLLITLAISAWRSGVGPIAAIAPFAVHLADTGTTLIRRVCAGEPWWRPHRKHVYQRLVSLGWSHQQVTALVGLLTSACAGLGAVSMRWPGSGDVLAGIAIAVILGTYLGLPGFLGSRRAQAQVP